MLKGTLTRKRSTSKRYVNHLKNKKSDCEFCEFSKQSKQVINELPHFWIVKNIFSYDVWDSCGVLEQFMVVPKRHVDSLGSFNKVELTEYSEVLVDFEKKEYSIYSRAPNSIAKSIPHQHTHFIKLDNRRKKFLFFLRVPHIMMYK